MAAPIDLQISESDRIAILTALPLVSELYIPNPVNGSLLSMCADRAASVLKENQFLFSPGELRAISVAISSAVLICEGKTNSFTASVSNIAAWKDRLSPHYFVLKKLDPVLGHFCEVHLK